MRGAHDSITIKRNSARVSGRPPFHFQYVKFIDAISWLIRITSAVHFADYFWSAATTSRRFRKRVPVSALHMASR